MWTPTTPTRTPALLNIDKQSQKGKKNNKHKSSWLHSGCFGERFLTVKEAAAVLQANKQCLERSLSINAPLTYLSANIYHEIGEAARAAKQTRRSGETGPPRKPSATATATQPDAASSLLAGPADGARNSCAFLRLCTGVYAIRGAWLQPAHARGDSASRPRCSTLAEAVLSRPDLKSFSAFPGSGSWEFPLKFHTKWS